MPMTEDFTAFFDEAEHACTVQAEGGSFTGIFDREYAELLNGIPTTQPRITAPTADVAAARASRQGARLRITSGQHEDERYRVVIAEEDGTGVTTLRLELLVRQ